jgi:hypothetical protein
MFQSINALWWPWLSYPHVFLSVGGEAARCHYDYQQQEHSIKNQYTIIPQVFICNDGGFLVFPRISAIIAIYYVISNTWCKRVTLLVWNDLIIQFYSIYSHNNIESFHLFGKELSAVLLMVVVHFYLIWATEVIFYLEQYFKHVILQCSPVWAMQKNNYFITSQWKNQDITVFTSSYHIHARKYFNLFSTLNILLYLNERRHLSFSSMV